MAPNFTTPEIAEAARLCGQVRETALAVLDGNSDPREVMTTMVYLRQANRKAQDAVKQAKDATTASKQAVDNYHLDIQNITYQHKHLKKEIALCCEYESKHEQLGMISREEFLELHPEYHDKPEHDLTMARLKDEESKRLELFVVKNNLNKERERLEKDVRGLSNDYENIDKSKQHLKAMLNVAEPLEQMFNKHGVKPTVVEEEKVDLDHNDDDQGAHDQKMGE